MTRHQVASPARVEAARALLGGIGRIGGRCCLELPTSKAGGS